jgi:hypothetical protein
MYIFLGRFCYLCQVPVTKEWVIIRSLDDLFKPVRKGQIFRY